MNDITLDDLKKVKAYYENNLDSLDETITSIEVYESALVIIGKYKRYTYSVAYSLETKSVLTSGIHFYTIRVRKDFIPCIKNVIISNKKEIDKFE